jgi:D-arginine dehydrogenase
MTIDVAALVAGYRSGLARRGGRVETARGAVSLEAGTDGWTVTTAGGGVLGCRYVVNAAGAWADSVARRAGVGPLGLQPYRRTAFVFAVAGHRTAGWPLVMDSRERFYFEPDPAGLLASPADETPVEPHDARADELAMARATEALGESTTLAIRGVRHRWAGLRTFVADRVPVAGFDPRAPGFFWLAGQGGAGIKTAPALAGITRALIAGEPVPAWLGASGGDAGALDPARLLV